MSRAIRQIAGSYGLLLRRTNDRLGRVTLRRSIQTPPRRRAVGWSGSWENLLRGYALTEAFTGLLALVFHPVFVAATVEYSMLRKVSPTLAFTGVLVLVLGFCPA